MKFKKHQPLQENTNAKEYVNRKYREFANLQEDAQLTADDLDNDIVDRVSMLSRHNVEDVREWLTEATSDETTIDAHNKAVAAEVNAKAQIDEEDSKGVIERELDAILKTNLYAQKRGGTHFNNILFEGAAGTGKTSRIIAWAKENNINLVLKKASEMDESDFGVVVDKVDQDYASKKRTSEFDNLDKPRSVLFLDEYNRARASVRATLLTLVNDHVIIDPQSPDGLKHFPNFLFTIAAINPFSANYDTKEMDAAEESRFATVAVPNEPKVVLSYFMRKYDKWIAEDEAEGEAEMALMNRGRKEIARTLLTSKLFEFDNPEDEDKVMTNGNRKPLNLRSFESALDGSDGTKNGFLAQWNKYCNSDKKAMVDNILKNYVDVQDKANDAIGVGREDAPRAAGALKRQSSLASKIYGNR